jgi:uncharacterized protein (DUF362 family)
MMRPTFVIADARKILMRNGPTGGSLNDVKRSDAIVVGNDHIAVDSYCVQHADLLDRKRSEILYLDKALQKTAARGIAATDWKPQWTQEITV